MLDVDAQDWPALSRLLDEALELPATERARWLATLPPEGAAHRSTLARLLAQQGGPETNAVLAQLPRFAEEADSDDDPPLAPGMRVGAYVLLSELGRGGMGSVWLAERVDGHMRRTVALKLPRVGWGAGFARRLARERDILAGLEHPHIARLYDAGGDRRGRPFLALEYVDGVPIDAYAKSRAIGVEQKLALLLQVCSAVAFAHSRLVVHRDLKPSNILVTDAGQVRLLDFGIAKLLQGESAEETQLTRTFGQALTLEYASPEQIRGEPVGTASDVYSLGVVAYELLAGARPYRLKRSSAAELEEAIAAIDPVPASQVASNARTKRALVGDLDAILNKALKKAVDDRYATVDALADDIRRHLSNEPVLAQPDAFWYRLRKRAIRNRLPLAFALVLMAGLTAALWQRAEAIMQARRATAAAQRAAEEAERANQVKQFMVNIFADANPDAHGKADSTPLVLLQQAARRLATTRLGSPELDIEVRDALGRSLAGLGSYREAQAVLADAARRAEQAWAPGDPRTLAMRLALAEALSAASRVKEAAPIVDDVVLRAREAGRTAQWVEALQARSNLEMYDNRPEQAEATAREAVELLQRAKLSDLRLQMKVYGQQADVLLWRHRPGAAAAAEQAVSAAARLDGPNASGSQWVLRGVLAEALALEGRPDDAVAEVDRVVRHYREAFGDQHPRVVTALNSAGTVKDMAGRLVDAIGDYEEAQRILDASTADPREVASNTVALADAYRRIGRLDDSLRRIDQALARAQPALGADHGVIRALQRARAEALIVAGRLDEAVPLVDGLIADASARPHRLAPALSVRGRLRLAQGRPAEAAADAERAAQALDGTSMTAFRARATTTLSLALHDLHADARARDAAQAALQHYARLGDNLESAEARKALGQALVSLGQVEEGQALLRQARAEQDRIAARTSEPARSIAAAASPR